MIKIIIAASRLPGMIRWDYSQHLLNVHEEKMLAAPADFLANLASYVQNHVVDAAYGARGETGIPPTEVDSVSETYHPSLEAVSFLTAHPYYLSVIQPDEHLFANPDPESDGDDGRARAGRNAPARRSKGDALHRHP